MFCFWRSAKTIGEDFFYSKFETSHGGGYCLGGCFLSTHFAGVTKRVVRSTVQYNCEPLRSENPALYICGPCLLGIAELVNPPPN
jgi:hypothetical protein